MYSCEHPHRLGDMFGLLDLFIELLHVRIGICIVQSIDCLLDIHDRVFQWIRNRHSRWKLVNFEVCLDRRHHFDNRLGRPRCFPERDFAEPRSILFLLVLRLLSRNHLFDGQT